MIKELCPKGVERVKLGDCCAFQRGTSITSTETIPGNIPVISGGLKPSYFHNKSNRTGDTITVAGSGASSGFVDYWTTPIWVADAFTVEPNELLNRRYVYFFLKNNQRQIYQFQKGAGVPHVHGRDLANLSIPLPPLSVQREIVSALDSFTSLIDKMKQEVEMRKRQMEYYREKMMTFEEGECEWKTLGRCITNLRTGLNPRVHFKLNTPDADGYYITVRELKGFRIEPDEKTDRINKAAIQRINERSNLQIGDILFSGTGTIGRTAYVDKLPNNWNIKEGIYALTPNKEILNSIFLIHYFMSSRFMDKIMQRVDGAIVRSIPMAEFRNILIPIPPLPVQRRIVATLDTFETYITKMERLIALRQKQYEYYRERLLTFA